MNTIIIIINGNRYDLTMMWSVIEGFDIFSVLIEDSELLKIDGPIINFINISERPLYKAIFQRANANEDEILLRQIISEAIDTQFLPHIRNKYSEDWYKKSSN